MFKVNMVFDDEELLEPYEWEDDDDFKSYSHLSIYHVNKETLHDFLYGKLVVEGMNNDVFIISNGECSFVVEMRDGCIYRRGSLSFSDRDFINRCTCKLDITNFQYRILEEAYEKEFGLTRSERTKKIFLEDMLDEMFVVRFEYFKDICNSLHIYEDNPSELYLSLKRKIEKGYTKFHELLYLELISKS